MNSIFSNQRMCNGTPKRRLSYEASGLKSTTPTSSSSSVATSSSKQTTTNIIKRKCTNNHVWFNNSPIYSSKYLNESFETLQINNENENPEQNQQSQQKSIITTHCKNKRILLSRYKTAPPIEMLRFDETEASVQQQQLSVSPLNDISNTIDNFDNLWKSETASLPVSHNSNNGGPSCLIGDLTRPHLLPYKHNHKHQDLYSITADTLIDVLNGQYADSIEHLIIIDSRYPYEYDGGHIRLAKNIYTKEKLLNELFQMDVNYHLQALYKSSTPGKRIVFIFHCEFSSERGPSLLRFLRNHDRSLNENQYPNLYYPELYLLEGGYKSFYEKYMEYCEPKTYKPMLHAEHLNDLKHFRLKAKSWEIQKHQLSAATNQLKLSASTLTIKHFQKTFSFQKPSDQQDEQII